MAHAQLEPGTLHGCASQPACTGCTVLPAVLLLMLLVWTGSVFPSSSATKARVSLHIPSAAVATASAPRPAAAAVPTIAPWEPAAGSWSEAHEAARKPQAPARHGASTGANVAAVRAPRVARASAPVGPAHVSLLGLIPLIALGGFAAARAGAGAVGPSPAPRYVALASTAGKKGPPARDSASNRENAAADDPEAPGQTPPPTPPPTAAAEPEALPAVSRGDVARSCLLTTFVLAGLGGGTRLGLHALAGAGLAPAQWDMTTALPFWPASGGLDGSMAGPAALALGVCAGLAVTAARFALLQSGAWPEFAAATDRSNGQILTPLGPADLVWVACLPAWSEELLFRGVVQPALGNAWLGVCVSGAVFGALHKGGGRNAAFAVWATSVGVLYGVVAAVGHSVAPAVVAHSVGNLTSAAAWRALRTPPK